MSEKKIFIENLVDKMAGNPETELPTNTTIRFEINGKAFKVSFEEMQITTNSKEQTVVSIRTEDGSFDDEKIKIIPSSSNKIIVL